MMSASDLRPGSTVERGGDLYTVLEFQHVKIGRGGAIVRAKLKNVISGAVTEETFRPEEKFGRARIDRNEAQFLYKDGENFIVMDTSSYEQFPISPSQMGESAKWLKESDSLFLLRAEERVIGIELPIAVELEITETEPGFKGDTANAATKPATVETGAVVDVPLFVEAGQKIRVDTRTGKYMERV